MNRFLIGLFVFISAAMVALAAIYPEDFALALGAFVMGSLLGAVAAYHAYTSIHDRGFERSQQLSLKQVSNPASILREQRMAMKEEEKKTKSPQKPPQQQAIPRFQQITGLDN